MDGAEVLVVGAGPTGLTLACGLRLHGIAVRVIDKAPGPATTSRANILYGRGMEVLDRMGALGDLPERSIAPGKLSTYVNGRHALTMHLADFFDIDGRSQALYVSQAEIEASLRSRLANLGVEVEWATELLRAEDNAGAVSAAIGNRNADAEEVVRVGFMVGCDGAHSTVRKLADIGFPGVRVIEQFLLADVNLEWTQDRTAGCVFMHRNGVLAAIPMRALRREGNLWRLMANVTPEGDNRLDDKAIVERFERLLAERADAKDVRIHDATWTSVFRIQRRLADVYRRGRILLAGDAAHIHSPFGGQGMNTGVGDAENLAWKLALVVTGRAGEALLDTYQAERRPLATEVLRRTTGNTKLLVGEDPFRRFVRDRVLFPIGRLKPVQRRNAMVASQLWVSYRRGPLDGSGFGTLFGGVSGGPRPGDRIPSLACVLPAGGKTWLHDELGGYWALLVPPGGSAGGGAGGGGGGSVAAYAMVVREQLGDLVCTLERTDGFPEMWLVRPDGHLAWRGRLEDAGGADGLRLQRWLENALR